MSKNNETFVKGAAILAVFGLLGKLLGSIFRIPLTNIIGAEGMANYQIAYPVYALLIVISTSGLPAAISRMVAERVSVGDHRGAHKVFTTAFAILALLGTASAVLLFAVSGQIAAAVKMPSASLSLVMISPALLLVSLLSAYRGYFQGLQIMTPTAITQFVEQAVKLAAGLFLAYLWAPGGVEYGAAGALLGVSLSEACALIVIIVLYRRKSKNMLNFRLNTRNTQYSSGRSILRDLAAIALPVTLGGCLMPAVGFADTLIVTNAMAAVDYSSYNPLSAGASFGVLTGSVNPLINMPAVLSLALCMSLVPAISEARANGNISALRRRSAFGFKLSMLIGLPCAAGMYALARPVISLLYSGGLSADELAVGADLLRILSLGVLFLTVLQTLTGILQGAGHQIIPLISLGIGAAVKVVLSIVLIKIPSLNISGAAIGTVACYGVAAVINTAAVIKHIKPGIKTISGLLAPAASAAVMAAFVYFLCKLLSPVVGSTAATLLSIAGAIIIYSVLLLVTGSLKKEDMDLIPGGIIVKRFMYRIKLWED
jgi:stage V sporulation protein B